MSAEVVDSAAGRHPLPRISVVSPAFNEAASLPLLAPRLAAVLDSTVGEWEWIVVDDGSTDGTSEELGRLAAADPRVRWRRLPHNCGSHGALLRGFRDSRGEVVVVLAADLQDPPEVCAELWARHGEGWNVVWATRRDRAGEGLGAIPARLYHLLVRGVGKARSLPIDCAGCCLLSRTVVDRLLGMRPEPVDLFAAVARLDEPSATVVYQRAARRHGRSGWTFRRKVAFALRSLAASR